VKPVLESLEDRLAPSVTPGLPPQAAPLVAAATTLYNDAVKTVETAISTYQHLGDTIRARLEAALHHHQQSITPFAGPLSPPPVNTFTWDPPDPASNDLASYAYNWLLNGQVQPGPLGKIPGNAPGDIVQFDGNVSNQPIEWNGNFVFYEMVLGPTGGGAYTGLQTIDSGDTVEMTGTTALATNVTSSKLNLDFASNSVFKVDGNATITNMTLAGNQAGQFKVHGGTTTLGQPGGFTDTIGVPILIAQDGTLTDNGNNPLKFTNNNLTITVQGYMQVATNGTGATLIDNGGFSNDYIKVDGGTLG
jgi:hypothetical protein